MTVRTQSIAIIGAGLAGLTCARRLVAAGLEVHLYDKSRGAGGRMCTRRADEARFDHGAQYFTATAPVFQREVEEWISAGVVAQWDARFACYQGGELRPDPDPRPRWVAQPRMSALGRHLAEPLDVRLRSRVSALERTTDGWTLTLDGGESKRGYGTVLLSCPEPQVRALLPAHGTDRPTAAVPGYAPCWAVMVEFPEPVSCLYDGIRFSDHALGWAARDSSKPGRAEGERWVLHGSPEWSATHLERDNRWAESALLDAFSEFGCPAPLRAMSHRWRYALARVPEPAGVTWSPSTGVGVFGDGWVAPKVEGAWASGVAMAQAVLESLS